VGGTDTGATVLDRLAVEWVRELARFREGRTLRRQEKGSKNSETLKRGGGFNVLRDGELSEVVANHLRLDLDLVEFLARVNADDASNHLGDDNHITEVGLDEVGLLVGLGLLLGLPELLDQAHGLALEAAVDSTPGAGVDELAEFIGREVEETGNWRGGKS